LQCPHILEGAVAVAATAVRSELTVVNVVRAVTPTTGVTRIAHRSERASVAIVAGNVHVGAFQQEIGLRVVIEQPEIPGNRVVAVPTIVLKIAVVRVVISVAGNALAGSIRKDLCLVAVITLNIPVFTKQREVGQIV
jgi:hypothetical protein